MKTKTLRKDKVNLITLGCSKNLVDSENILTQLEANDYAVTHDGKADAGNVVIINTCGFIDRAKEESVNTILEYAEIKNQGDIDKLYVTGCLSERYKQNLEEEIPEVDAFFGTLELPGLLAKLEADYKHDLIGERLTTTPQHYAYLKISEGCNRTCAFCAIPLMRGKHISQPIEVLVQQAENFARNGVKELMLIAQELTYYGLDLYKKRALADLLNALAEVEGIEWIRLHYAYPNKFPLEILDVIANQPKVCNYLDIPLQHATDNVLEAMRRQITKKETIELVHTIREKVPTISLRTTILTGFPNETEEDFEELCDFVKEMRFDRMGVFQYSHEEDTIAYEMEDSIAAEEKARRANTLMDIQMQISLEKNQEKIGKAFKVLIDRKEGEYWVGRTEGDSPEVDNEVLVNANDHYLRIGDFAQIKIIDAMEYDLIGEPVSL